MHTFDTKRKAQAWAKAHSKATQSTVWVVSHYHWDDNGHEVDEWEDFEVVCSSSRPSGYVCNRYTNGVLLLDKH